MKCKKCGAELEYFDTKTEDIDISEDGETGTIFMEEIYSCENEDCGAFYHVYTTSDLTNINVEIEERQ